MYRLGWWRSWNCWSPLEQAIRKPVFAQKDLKFVSARALGKSRKCASFYGGGQRAKRWEMMYFGGKDNFEAYAAEKYGQTALDGLYSGKAVLCIFDVVYYPGVNTWQGIRSCSL